MASALPTSVVDGKTLRGRIVEVHVDEKSLRRQLRKLGKWEREISSDALLEDMFLAAKAKGLPPVKRAAPGGARSRLARLVTVTVSRSRKAVIMELEKKPGAFPGDTKGSVIALSEFGGTVTTPIRPKGKRAVTPGPGIARAAVNTRRHYRKRLWFWGSSRGAFPFVLADAERRSVRRAKKMGLIVKANARRRT